MYPGTVAVLFRYFFKDDSSPAQPSNPTPTPSDDPTPTPTPSDDPTPTPTPTPKPSVKPTQKPDSEDDEEDESGVPATKPEIMDLVAEEVEEGSLTYVESNQFGFSRAYTLRSLNLDGKVKRVVNTKEI